MLVTSGICDRLEAQLNTLGQPRSALWDFSLNTHPNLFELWKAISIEIKSFFGVALWFWRYTFVILYFRRSCLLQHKSRMTSTMFYQVDSSLETKYFWILKHAAVVKYTLCGLRPPMKHIGFLFAHRRPPANHLCETPPHFAEASRGIWSVLYSRHNLSLQLDWFWEITCTGWHNIFNVCWTCYIWMQWYGS